LQNKVTSDRLTLNREFAISRPTVGVTRLRIRTQAGDNPEEPALIGDAINTAFTVNASLDIYAAAISGSGGTVNVVLTIIFAILFFAMSAR
jgi:alkylhydroperoxidase family enzyme|tara:strand:+ start:280 stop:552 length:273 start_codon:yes stop_codon:yes gene_type:complete